MTLRELAPDVHIIEGRPRWAINVYLIDDVLVDAGSRHAAGRIKRQLDGRPPSLHVLTHAHADHAGSSHELCQHYAIPLWCGTGDADSMEAGEFQAGMPPHPVNRLIRLAFPGPPHPVARRLSEGDEVAGFTVLDTPGHSAGHISLWRESDRTLVCGDVFTNIDTLTGVPGLHEPKRFFTPDPERNRESMRRLAALEPRLVLFGHGRPLRDGARLRKLL